MKTIWAVLLAVLGVSCGFVEDKRAGESGASAFHSQFNAEKFDDIYSSATEAFRKSISLGELTEYCAAIRRKLGPFESAETRFVNVNSTNAGKFVSLALASQFEQGEATEEFVFLLEGEQMLLERYNINSKLLVLK